MFISKSSTKNNVYYRIAETHYAQGKKKTVILENLGSAASLKEKYPNKDPQAVAEERLAELKAQVQAKEQILIPSFSSAKRIPIDQQRSFKIGYLFLQKYYYRLGLKHVCQKISERYHFSFDLNAILSTLLYTRILYPSSKLSSYTIAQSFLEKPKMALHDIYRALEVIAKENDFIQQQVYQNSKKRFKRQDKILFYDCTNYFFEIEQESGSKKYGFSKDHKPNPLVQMGLFYDGSGLPLAFSLFPGNQNEQASLLPLEKKILKDFHLAKFVVCTDAGLGATAQRKFNSLGNRAFVTTQSLKKLKAHLRDWALDPTGWYLRGEKGRFDLRTIDLSAESNTNKLYYKSRWIKENGFEQNLVVSFSPKYRQYLRTLRSMQIERAKKKIKQPSQWEKKRSNDPARFVRVVACTEEGEVADRRIYGLNEEIIDQEECYDGFYAVCTNLEDSPLEIMAISHQRWQIEAAFRILKSEFKARPVFLQREDRILAHFTTCFLSLLLYKLLEQDLKQQEAQMDYSMQDVVQTLRDMQLFSLAGQGFSPAYTRTLITDALHTVVGFRTDYEALSNQTIRKIVTASKKTKM